MGWTGMQAWAEEIAGERARALRLYRQCGNLREVRRLELADSESAGLKHNTELKHGAGLPHGEGLPDGAGPQQHESADGLSSRERRIVALVVEGKSNRSIATTLELSEKTVERHLTSIFEKLGFRSRTELATSVVAQRPTRLSPIGDVPRL
jgi:DNA-binding NarL/FixJ family response regulator